MSLESDEALERADAVRELTASRGWAVLIEALERSERQLVDNLVMGKVKQHEEYAKRTGEINGMKIARELPAVILGIAEKVKENLRAGGAGEEDESP